MTQPPTISRQVWGLYLALACVTVAVYWQVHRFEFLNFDDPSYVTANPNVFREPTAENIAWAFRAFHAGNWHPVTWISHMLDCWLFGPAPRGHHLVNVFLHVTNTLLLFALLRRLTGAVFRSAMVAALFALHPLHVESVAWIAERKDVLSTCFGLLSLNAYARYANLLKEAQSKYRLMYGSTLIFFVLGLMSKPMLVTLPFIFLLLDFWPLQRFSRANIRRLILEKIPFLALSAAVSVVTVFAQKEAMVSPTALPFHARLINAVGAYVVYLRKMILPTDLAPYYPYRHDIPLTEIVISLLILIGASALVVRWARRVPYLFVGWFWYLGMLVPVIGLVQVGGQSMADRYTYFPIVGIFVMCVWGTADLFSRFRRGTVVASVTSAAILLGSAWLTSTQLHYWYDSETLFRRDLELYPTANAMGHHCLGRALFLKGDNAGAMEHQEEVLRLMPAFPAGHLYYANSLSRAERFDEALLHYQEAIRLKPKDPEVYKCLGTCLAAQMKLDDAKACFLKALELKPDYPEAYTRLGTAEMAQGKVEDALRHLAKAVEIYPDHDEGQYYLANALADRKRYEEAITHFRAAIKANPNYAAALDDLAWIFVTQKENRPGDFSEVIALSRRACDLTQSTNVSYLQTLGAALSETGRFPEAVVEVERAIKVATAEARTEIAAQLKRQLSSYQSGRSYTLINADR